LIEGQEKKSVKKSHTPLLITAGFMVSMAVHLFAGDVKVIANRSVRTNSISTTELRSIFLLQRRTLSDGSAVLPVLQKSGPIHEAFLRQYLDRDDDEMQTYYQGLVFTGKASMPKELHSDDEVVAYVARTRGAIGYVSSVTAAQKVKVLEVVSEHRSERLLLKRVEPEYPETLRQMKIGGVVRLQVTISPQGRVETVSLLGGNPILGEAAAKAMQQWVYAPARSRTTIEVSIPFQP
jgi:TonB family protein